MGETTEIAWTDATFNPWWGCSRVSPGCEHCYAETFATRFGTSWGVSTERRLFANKHWAEPLRWNAAAEREGLRKRVFCASMADVFEDRRDLDAQRARLWTLIESTPALDWLLLTKRPNNMRVMLPEAWLSEPRHNVWLGTTAEDQRRANERIPELLATPAVVRFVSAEPLLGPIDFRAVPGFNHVGLDLSRWWIIVGGESGRGARMFDLSWARSIVAQCRVASVPVFVKQLGAAASDAEGLVAVRLKHSKGGNVAEWPEDLRVREWPKHRDRG